MPGIGNTTFELNNKTYFFKIGRNNIIDKKNEIYEPNIEYTIYEIIRNERNQTLKKYFELIKNEKLFNEEAEILLKRINNQIQDINSNDNDIYYEIVEQKFNKNSLLEYIYNNIKFDKNYNPKIIFNAFQKIKDEENNSNDELKEAYLIKLYCFNFICFNYRENELKKNKEFKKDDYINKIKSNLKESKLPESFSLFYLENGIGLNNENLFNQIANLKKNEIIFQKVLQQIMKQIQTALFLFHHLSKDFFLYHNDLKLGNIMLMNYNYNEKDNINTIYEKITKATFKIMDFDLTRKNDCITYYKFNDPNKEEMFEIGQILWVLITHQTLNKIEKNKIIQNPLINKREKLCENIFTFLHKSLQIDENYRMDCDSGFLHPFIINDESQFNNILNFEGIPEIFKTKKGFYLPINYPFFSFDTGKYKETELFEIEF